MRICAVMVMVLGLVACTSREAVSTQYHSGDVWGTWTKGTSPHIITGDVRVPPESTLVIEAGCRILFRDYYKLVVDSAATLRALGTTTDSILFDEETPGTSWHGIRFFKADTSCTLSYCRLQHGKAAGSTADAMGGAIYLLSSNLSLAHCVLDTNQAEQDGGAIYGENSNLALEACVFRENAAGEGCTYGGAVCSFFSTVTVSNSTFTDNSGFHGGAMYFGGATCTIANSVFSSNLAQEDGGAIEAHYYSTISITGSFFGQNSATNNDYSEGGALCCSYSTAAVSDCIFISNYSGFSGGAVLLVQTTAQLTANIFISNTTFPGYSDGGAISCKRSTTGTIRENTFISNSAGYGGAIFCQTSCTPTISQNSFAQNSSLHYGGGVCLSTACNTPLDRNTFSRNSAGDLGGAIYCWYSDPLITNSILWGDTAPTAPEIYEYSSNLLVTYSNIQGGWPGEGNINANPYFINAPENILQLQHSSPCIDAGDPTSPLDPDNTRADMGAYYFDQSVTPSIELYPHDTPITIPRPGGRLEYDGWVYNLADTSVNVDIWTYALLPNHSRYGPIRQYNNVRIRPHARMGMNNIGETVPAMAPPGEYRYVGYVGDFPSAALDSSDFMFSKSR